MTMFVHAWSTGESYDADQSISPPTNTYPLINGVVGRVDRSDNRYYVDPTDEKPYDSVTTILSATEGKPWLAKWTAKLAAEFAVEQHEFVGETIKKIGNAAAADLIKGEANRARDLKADIGSYQHDILEALILDRPIPSIPKHLKDIEIDGERVDQDAIADGLLNFITDFTPTWEMAEATVANVEYGFAGTLDVVAWLPSARRPGRPAKGARLCLDLKTGAKLDQSARPQIVSYKRCTEIWIDDLGNKAVMPTVDLCGILHLRREYRRGYKLLIIDSADEQFYFDQFLERLGVYKRQTIAKAKRLTPFYPPLPDGTQPLPLLEDIDDAGFNKCKKTLVAAGLETLADLSMMTSANTNEIKGIGPAAIAACHKVLRHHGLTFAGEAA